MITLFLGFSIVKSITTLVCWLVIWYLLWSWFDLGIKECIL